MPENVPAWTLWVPAIAAIGGSVITGFVAFWTARQIRKSEEKKHLRGLLFNAAIENWKTRMGIMKDLGGSVQPLDSFIIHMLKFSELLEKDITKDNVSEIIKSSREFGDIMQDTYTEILKNKYGKPAEQKHQADV